MSQAGKPVERPTGATRRQVSTYCYQCVNGPDLLTVETVDGTAVGIGPNFDLHGLHPADGKICVKPYGLVQKTYNPHRILTPLKRTNPRKGRDEDPGWVEIGWDEALETVASRLKAIRNPFTDAQGNPRLAFTTGGAGTPKYYMGSFPALFAAWGGPVDLSIGSGTTVACYHSEHLYGELWHRAFTVLPDTPRCNYIIAFGNNINASGGVPSVRRQADARARGMKRIQIEPHLSVTGATAHEWIPIRPKTDAAFLYAMLHVLLHEHRAEELDTSFLKQRTAAPYLVAPNGYFLRDAATRKPLIWDAAHGQAVPFDTVGTDPALLGRFVASGIEHGPDGQIWRHDAVTAFTAHQATVEHVATCSPEWAETICDVPAANIRRIANEFLSEARVGETTTVEGRTMPYRPVAILLGKAVNNGWGGYECVWAQTLLQVLVGSLEVPGGLVGSVSRIVGPGHDRMASCTPGEDGFMPYPFFPTDKANWRKDPEVRHGHSTLVPMAGIGPLSQWLGSSTLTWMRLQGRAAESWPQPSPPDVWIVYRCNPLISNSDTARLAETIARFPFQVSFAYTHDETSHFADIILPDCTDLESMQLLRIGGTESFEQIWEAEGWALRQPAVAPRGEARDFDWIGTQIARRVGILRDYNTAINAGACGISLKTEKYDFSLETHGEHSSEEIWEAVCRAASHDLTRGESSEGLDYYRQHGFRLRPFSRLNWYLYPRMEDQGLRFELPYQERILRVGRQLANRLHETGVAWWDRQLGEYEALPHFNDLNRYWNETLERNYGIRPGDYPFWVLTSRSMQYSWGGNVAIQLIKEVADNVIGHDGVQINAATAARLGIGDGDAIEVYSPTGSVTGKAILRQGIRPDVVLIMGQFAHWKTPFAKGFGMPSANSLVPMHPDFLDGSGGAVDGTKVNIRLAGGTAR